MAPVHNVLHSFAWWNRKSTILLYIIFANTSTWASGFSLWQHCLSWEVHVLPAITHSLVWGSKNIEGLSILLGEEGRADKEKMSTQCSFKIRTVSKTVAQDFNIPGLMCASADEEPAPPSEIIHLGHCPSNTRRRPNVYFCIKSALGQHLVCVGWGLAHKHRMWWWHLSWDLFFVFAASFRYWMTGPG